MKRRLAIFGALALSALLLVAAAACGSDDGDEAAPQPQALGTTAAPAAAAAPTTAAAPALAAAAVPTTAAATTTKAAPAPTQAPPKTGRKSDDPLAPELRDTGAWINSDPFTVESQRGKVVLIDFWTYTCINCIRTLPYLKSWHDRYAEEGLVILGVHTPEFEFEKVLTNVQDAVAEFEIEYAVVQDNDFGTWRAYRNRFWPAKYLIDKDGYIRYTHFGEGAYEETEEKIRELLAERGSDLSGISSQVEPAPALDAGTLNASRDEGLTRELYAGLARNFNALQSGATPPYVLHSEFFQQPGEDVLYTDPGQHENHFLYLEGLWRSTEDSLVHARETDDFIDYVAIRFYATTVNGVMAPLNSEAFTVRLTIDDVALTPDQAGSDVMFDDDGNSFVLVDQARMYRLVEMGEYAGHELKLIPRSPDMQLFAFTFGPFDTGR